jgi:glycosyltransferase involved in cell wall biosynthesis
MNLGKTVLVNGKSEVMKGHAIRSENAAEFYDNEIDFQNKIQKYILNSELLKGNELKAIAYVQDNYNWDKILNKLRVLINEIS